MTDVQLFTAPDGTEMVIITRARFDALLAAEEELEDIAAAEEGEASLAEEGGIPLEVMTAIQSGMHPIAAWRRHRDMTQEQLAEAADMTQAGIARLEKADPGSGRPATLDAIARALDAPRWSFELAPASSAAAGKKTGFVALAEAAIAGEKATADALAALSKELGDERYVVKAPSAALRWLRRFKQDKPESVLEKALENFSRVLLVDTSNPEVAAALKAALAKEPDLSKYANMQFTVPKTRKRTTGEG